MVNFDTAFSKEFFHVSVRQAISQVPTHGEHDDFGREPAASERRTVHRRWLFVARVHVITLAWGPADPSTQQRRVNWSALQVVHGFSPVSKRTSIPGSQRS